DKLRDQRLQRQPQLFADFSSRHASYDNPLLAVGPVVLAALNVLSGGWVTIHPKTTNTTARQ
ncbi:hypothetical protein, partial [Ralstonia solanacearum]|uniref:hypothetical protein n=3 Tax=Ralstonia solanacearum species complex TaxID=3116862 RepID=UPI001E4A1324